MGGKVAASYEKEELASAAFAFQMFELHTLLQVKFCWVFVGFFRCSYKNKVRSSCLLKFPQVWVGMK